jgi:alkyl hydroperoxide reductase subunit AhpC
VELQGRLKELQGQGLGVAAISYDRPEILTAFARQQRISFPLLSDADSTAIKAFGILNPAVEWGLGPEKDDPAVVSQVQKYVAFTGRAAEMMRGMALPGTFIVDRRGRVTSRFFEEYYTDRSTTESVLLKINNAAAPVQGTRISSSQLDFTAYTSDASVAVGSRFSIVLDVVPHRGMHVYAPDAASYQPIRLSLAPQPFLKVLAAQYPSSEVYFFKPLNERVPVYQKPFRIVQDVVVEATGEAQKVLQSRDSLTLTGTVDYQACDDKICYNPVSVPVSFTVGLNPLVRERPVVASPASGPPR